MGAKVEIAKVQVFLRGEGWRFRAKGANGEVVAREEAPYTGRNGKRDAIAAAEAIAGGAPVEVQEA